MKTLKALYWFAFLLEASTFCFWIFAGFIIYIPFIPATLTAVLFYIHIRSYQQLKSQGYVSTNVMRIQLALGISVASALATVVFILDNLDCLDVCTHAPNHLYRVSIPETSIVFIVALGLVILPYFLNRKLTPQTKTTR